MKKFLFFLLFAIAVSSCHSSYTIVKKDYDQTTMNNVVPVDSAMVQMIQPYKDSVDKTMNNIIGYAKVDLKKEQPEGTLCNWVCDALLEETAAAKPDLCVLNYGGLRVPQIAAGPITTGRIFELMPFDNLLIMLYIPGNKLQQLLDLTAEKKGWPIGGFQMQISKEKKADNIFIKGEPINPAKTYRLLTNDYMANGGDNCSFLTGVPRENLNLLIRDVLISNCKKHNAKGEKVAASKDGRITVSE